MFNDPKPHMDIRAFIWLVILLVMYWLVILWKRGVFL